MGGRGFSARRLGKAGWLAGRAHRSVRAPRSARFTRTRTGQDVTLIPFGVSTNRNAQRDGTPSHTRGQSKRTVVTSPAFLPERVLCDCGFSPIAGRFRPRVTPLDAGAFLFLRPRSAPAPREPLNTPRVAATEAFRDEMPHLPTEATRSPWQVPCASGATADRPRSWQLSPVPPGFGAMASSALLRGLRIE